MSWRRLVAVFTGVFVASSNAAADDAAERVYDALREETVAKHSPNTKVTISGYINRALYFWNDGVQSGIYSVDNQIAQSRFRVGTELRISEGLKTGSRAEFSVAISPSGAVDQITSDIAPGVRPRILAWWIEGRDWGKLSVGTFDGAARFAEAVGDQSGAQGTLNAVVTGQWNRQMFVRSADNSQLDVRWGRFGVDDFDIGRRALVRYDLPSVGSWRVSASAGEDAYWDIAANWSSEWSGMSLKAGIAYIKWADNDSDFGCVGSAKRLECNAIIGSVGLWHKQSGLFTHVGGGYRTNDLNDGSVAEDHFLHWVGGYRTSGLTTLGSTHFWAEHYTGTRNSVLGLPLPAGFGGIGETSSAQSATVSVHGLGVMQKLADESVELYSIFRIHDLGLDVVTTSGFERRAYTEKYRGLMVGARVLF